MRLESFTGALWITLIVLALILIIGSQIASVRRGAAGLFAKAASILSPLGGLGAAAKAFGASHWVRVGALVVLVGGPLVWGAISYIEGRGADRERIKAERANTEVAEHEARLERKAGELGINTTRDRARRETVIARAEQELEHAAAEVDPDALYERYLAAHCELLPHPGCADSPNPAPSGTEGVRRPRAHAA